MASDGGNGNQSLENHNFRLCYASNPQPMDLEQIAACFQHFYESDLFFYQLAYELANPVLR